MTRRLDKEETRAVIEPYFDAVRERFVEHGLKRASRTKLDVSQRVHDSERHFAATRDDGMLVIVSPELGDLPEDQVVGILAHELGHAVDFLYPARFQMAMDELMDWPSASWSEAARLAKAEVDDKAVFNRVKQWEKREHDLVERTADAVASLVFGRPIRYVGRCVLQSFERGVSPRPIGLR
jgi:hypothetical protein